MNKQKVIQSTGRIVDKEHKPVLGKYNTRIEESLANDYVSREKPISSSIGSRAKDLDQNWISDALEQLEQINEEATEENYPEISSMSIAMARELLPKLTIYPFAPAVYPSMDGDVSIFFKSLTKPAAILIRICSNQKIVCHTSVNKKRKRKYYNKLSEMPDDFLRGKLKELE